ncbi:hypothetical protein QQ054_10770 [Oscillatoria amoena NRMC-F 0135]|nr:hypothetical protein [Oscillatoria amoena NRMC-F 0135]
MISFFKQLHEKNKAKYAKGETVSILIQDKGEETEWLKHLGVLNKYKIIKITRVYWLSWFYTLLGVERMYEVEFSAKMPDNSIEDIRINIFESDINENF